MQAVCTQCSVFSVALQGKAMIMNLVSLVNELVNGLNAVNGQLKMVNTLITN